MTNDLNHPTGQRHGSFERERLPESLTYYESQGIKLVSKGIWRTAACPFHGGSDSLRINTRKGGYLCMACGAHGGDVLAFHMALHGLDFITAAKELGAWVDGRQGMPTPSKPSPLSARDAMQVLCFEALIVTMNAATLTKGLALHEQDHARLRTAMQRINLIAKLYR